MESFIGFAIAFSEVVNRLQTGEIADAGVATIEHDVGGVFVGLELLGELADGAEVEETAEEVGALVVVVLQSDEAHMMGALPSEDESGNKHPYEHSDCEVERDGDSGHDRDDEDFAFGHFAEGREGGPFEGADDDHEHHPGEGGDGDAVDKRSAHENEGQQSDSGDDAGGASAPAGADVDEALADHRATTHALEESGHDVGSTLSNALAVTVTAGLGEFVNELEGHERLDQADGGENTGVGQNEHQRLQIEGDVREVELREAALDGGEIAHDLGVEPEKGEAGDKQDRHERGRNGFGDFGEKMDHGHGQSGQSEHDPHSGTREPIAGDSAVAFLEHTELGEEDHDRETVDEAHHHGMGHEPDQAAELEHSDYDLDEAHQYDRSEEVFESRAGAADGFAFFHERHHDDGESSGGTGNHAGSSPERGGDQSDEKRGIESGERRDASDEREGDGLGHEGEGHGDPRQGVVLEITVFFTKEIE